MSSHISVIIVFTMNPLLATKSLSRAIGLRSSLALPCACRGSRLPAICDRRLLILVKPYVQFRSCLHVPAQIIQQGVHFPLVALYPITERLTVIRPLLGPIKRVLRHGSAHNAVIDLAYAIKKCRIVDHVRYTLLTISTMLPVQVGVLWSQKITVLVK